METRIIEGIKYEVKPNPDDNCKGCCFKGMCNDCEEIGDCTDIIFKEIQP